ncbi:hypothetical protein BbiDN127_A0057 (plasmid) [Borreliella bissettiae DN127]|uniref:Uncharacterized protein n=1 Tax=Borrelia bissettiae (strain DSM 17990 / CIP 109136 / DN127) TaxID=521010 RepID=G0API2_BORBD|nr:hypothetical protein BbiDN127_A0057 [Borreliella bissettiae DN127]
MPQFSNIGFAFKKEEGFKAPFPFLYLILIYYFNFSKSK